MGITHPKYKAAVVQAAPVWIDLEGTVAKTRLQNVIPPEAD